MNLPAVVSIIGLLGYGALIYVVWRRGPHTGGREQQLFLGYLGLMALWQVCALIVSLALDADIALTWYTIMSAVVLGQFVIYSAFARAFLRIWGQRGWLAVGTGLWALSSALIFLNRDRVISGVYWNNRTDFYLPEFGPMATVVAIPNYFFLVYTFVLLVKGYREADPGIERSRIQYLILGLAVVLFGTLANFVPALRPYPIDLVANILNALFITYAIFRYQLLDITIVIRGGLLYSIPTAILGASYFLVVYLAVNLFHLVLGYQVLLLSLLLAAITAVALQPLWTRMQSWLDRLFFREKYDAAMMLQRLSRTATSVLDLNQLTDIILDEVSTTMHIETMALYLKHEQSGQYRLTAQRGLEQGATKDLRGDYPIAGWLAENKSVLPRSDVDVLPRFKALWYQEIQDLNALQAELFVPLLVREELIGILVVGPQRSGLAYSQDEQLTLTTLANQTAVAVQSAWLISLEQRKAEESLALLDIARAVSSTPDLKRLLEVITCRTAQVCGVDRCTILRLDDEVGSLVPLMSQFGDGTRDRRLWAEFKSRMYVEPVDQILLLKRVLGQREPVLLGEGMVSRLPAEWIEPFGIKTLLVVPLVNKDRVTGLMVLDHIEEGRSFSDEQVNLASTIGTQVSIAIENARLYQEAMEEKEITETIVDEAFAGIMVVDDQARIVHLNPEVVAITGYCADELVGRRIVDVFGPELWDDGSILSQVMETGARVEAAEARIVGQHGTRDVLMGVTPFRDGYLLNFADISRLKEVDRLKSSIIANVSHELRAPLASIKAYAELLLDNLEGEDRALRHKFLSVIDQEADWLAELINDLLDLSRLESEQRAARLDLMSLAEVIHNVSALLDIQVRKMGVTIDLNLAPDLPLIMADKELVALLVKNLLSNAVKFSFEGGRVEVGAHPVGDEVVLYVADQGMGIPEEDQSQLFTKFFRSGLARESGIRGTGLGLALAKEAVELHQGRIEVESDLGVGTRLTVTLPIGQEAVMVQQSPEEWIHV